MKEMGAGNAKLEIFSVPMKNAGYDAAWVCFIGADPGRDLQDDRPSDCPHLCCPL